MHGGHENTSEMLVGRPEGKRPFEITMFR